MYHGPLHRTTMELGKQLLRVYFVLGMLIHILSADILTICGREYFNPNMKICCGGTLHPKIQSGKLMACCTQSGKAELYPKLEKICCGEQLISEYNRTNPPICCNNQLTDRTLYDCCGDEDFGVPYVYGKTCCADYQKKEFNVTTYKPRTTCCGTLLHNKDTQQCVRDTNGNYAVVKLSHIESCRGADYDSRIAVCCQETGKLLDIPVPSERNRLHTIVLPARWFCWDDKLVDRNKFYVNPNSSNLIPSGNKPCGAENYNPNNKWLKCCGQTLHSVRAGSNAACCGDALDDLDDDTEQCCGSNFIPSSQGCCNNVPFTKGRATDCCGRGLMNKMSEICCKTQSSERLVVFKQHPNHTSCCRDPNKRVIQTYNKYDKVCEGGEIEYKQTKTTSTTTPPRRHVPQITEIVNKQKCPFCSLKDLGPKECSKSNVYRFFVYRKRNTELGTVMNGVILSKYKLKTGHMGNGFKVQIRTRNQCRCFKNHRSFILFTNRKITEEGDKYNIRFKSGDVFIPADNIKARMVCQTWRQFHLTNKTDH